MRTPEQFQYERETRERPEALLQSTRNRREDAAADAARLKERARQDTVNATFEETKA